MCKVKSKGKHKIKLDFVCPHCEKIIDDFKSHAFKDSVNSLCKICDLAEPNQKCVDKHVFTKRWSVIQGVQDQKSPKEIALII